MTSVAIVHDYLTQQGGAERVVLCMLRAFPEASLHTSLYHPQGTFPEFASRPVRTTPLNRVGVLRRNHRLALPLLAPAFSTFDVTADVILCSSSGWAHGVRATGRKVVYCYAPPRWLYDRHRYLGGRRAGASAAAVVLGPALHRWDLSAAAGADRYLTVSSVMQARLREVYGLEAEVLRSPPAVTPDGPTTEIPDVAPGFFLCVSRLLPYKNVGVVVAAFNRLPDERLVVIGTGPERSQIEAVAGPNVTLTGSVLDEQLRWAYGACAGLVAASHEDYGLTPLEAGTFGKPSLLLRAGGYLDTLAEGVTGLFFDEPVPEAIVHGVRRLRAEKWSQEVIRDHVAGFSEAAFVRRLREVVDEEAAAASS